MTNEKTGIYQIRCRATGKLYVGSSVQIYRRWYQHRTLLRKAKHTSPHLQHAWTKHGADAFDFSVLEECAVDELEIREQLYLDTLKPAFNSITDVKKRIGAVPRAKMAASLRARAAKITHCPKGHAYDAANTYISRKGARICRRCSYERNLEILKNESPEQTAIRVARGRAYYDRNRDEIRVKGAVYTAAHKEEKLAYDLARRPETSAKQSARWRARTTEQADTHREKRRSRYAATVEPTSPAEKAAKISAALKALPKRTVCLKGHPLEGDNLYIAYNGKRLCQICLKARKAKHRTRIKASPEKTDALRASKRAYYHAHGDTERASMRARYRARTGQT